MKILYAVGAVTVLVGAILKMFIPQEASYIYMSGAVLFAVMQFLSRCRSNDTALNRLVWQQQLGGLLLVVAGVLMFTNVRNEWMVVMFIAALIELYTAFRIPQELERGRK